MSKRPLKIQFNGGELSPWLYGRMDIAKYNQTARLCRNFIPLVEGSLKRRGGTRFVAQTPVEEELLFNIVAIPAEAKVLINNEEQNSLYVVRGDTVSYEVSHDGYVTSSGQVTVMRNTTLEITLVSYNETCRLEIEAEPSDAVVKINGYERTTYSGFKNEVVQYIVYKDGYEEVSDSVVLDSSKTLQINLVAITTPDEGEYGDWGNPVAFVACTAYGKISPQKKCFLFRFENGYLPILFSSDKKAPAASDFDANLFFYNNSSGYDSLICASGNVNTLAVIKKTPNAIYYNNLDGSMIGAFDAASLKFMGWQRDDNDDYAAVYRLYDGSLNGHAVRVYYKGDLIYTLRGRNNG